MSLAAVVAGAMPLPAIAGVFREADTPRTLAFYNTHTHEKLNVCYYQPGGYDPGGLARIDYILRDHRTNTIKPIDTDLLDLLFAVKCRVRPQGPFHVISGYRSPATNEMLRRITSGVVKQSFHLKGQAIDIRLPGYDTAAIRDLCIGLGAGGVGYYARSDFVHLDVGPVRTW